MVDAWESDDGFLETIVSPKAVRLAAAANSSSSAGSRWREELTVFAEVSGRENKCEKELL